MKNSFWLLINKTMATFNSDIDSYFGKSSKGVPVKMWGKDFIADNTLEWKKDTSNNDLYELNIQGVLS